ncbi:CHC2 zinc finger domain-containing protein [Desulfonauticus submarinus]
MSGSTKVQIQTTEELKELFNATFPDHDFKWRSAGTKNGQPRFAGLCPWHEDTNQSLSVFIGDKYPIFHCFGCGKTGTPDNLIPRRQSEKQRKKELEFANVLANLFSEYFLQNMDCPAGRYLISRTNSTFIKFLRQKRLVGAIPQDFDLLDTALSFFGKEKEGYEALIAGAAKVLKTRKADRD